MGLICSKLCPKKFSPQEVPLLDLDISENLIEETLPESVQNKIKEILEENKKNDEFISSIDVEKEITKLEEVISTKLDEDDLKVVQLNNPKKEDERKKEIEKIQDAFLNLDMNQQDYIESVSCLGSTVKNSIIYQTYHHPEKFVKIEEAEKKNEGTTLFVEAALANLLGNNDITCAIEKDTTDEKSAKINLQLISSGEIFRKKITVSFEYGKEENAKILSCENEKEKYISQKKKEYSLVFNCPEDQIIITNLRSGSVKYDFMIKGREPTDYELEKIAKERKAKDIKIKNLIEGCGITPKMFDPRGDNKDGGWGIGEKRGPPNYLKVYDPPIGYVGYGLKVSKQYDNGDDTWLGYQHKVGEWYIAYHGTGMDAANAIIGQGFKANYNDGSQVHRNAKNINPLSQAQYDICGKGVYCSPVIKETECYGSGIKINGTNFYLTFMCRVNPYYVRISGNRPNYWVVSGDSLTDVNSKKYDSEIRPYRILLKRK